MSFSKFSKNHHYLDEKKWWRREARSINLGHITNPRHGHTAHPCSLLLSHCQILLISHSRELEGPLNSTGLKLSSGSCFPNWPTSSVLHPSEWCFTPSSPLLSSLSSTYKPLLWPAYFIHYASLEFILVSIYTARILVQASIIPTSCLIHPQKCSPSSNQLHSQTRFWSRHLTVASLTSRMKTSSLTTCTKALQGRVPPAFHPHHLPLQSFSSPTWAISQAFPPAFPCAIPPEWRTFLYPLVHPSQHIHQLKCHFLVICLSFSWLLWSAFYALSEFCVPPS